MGLVTGAQFIRSGTYKTVVVVGADALSRYIDWRDRDERWGMRNLATVMITLIIVGVGVLSRGASTSGTAVICRCAGEEDVREQKGENNKQ